MEVRNMYKLLNKTSRRSVKDTQGRVLKFSSEQKALNERQKFSRQTRENLEVKKVPVKRRNNMFSIWG